MSKSVIVIRWNDDTERMSGIIGVFETESMAKMVFKLLHNEVRTGTKDYFIEHHWLNDPYNMTDLTAQNITLE